MRRIRTLSERFEAKVVRGDGCWEWTGTHNQDGYALMAVVSTRAVRKFMVAHRYAYETEVGAVLEGMELDHLCRNRGCVNPAHVEPVTHQVNVKRGRVAETNREHVHRAQVAAAASWRARTHCPSGHEYNDVNTYITPKGHRLCRPCHAARELERYHSRRQRLRRG